MAKESKVTEWCKHVAVIYGQKSTEQLEKEAEIAFLAQGQKSGRLRYPSDWEEQEATIARQDAANQKQVAASYELVRGRLTIEAALEECAVLLRSAKDRAAGKVHEVPSAVVGFTFLDAEFVTANDVAQAEALQAEAQTVVDDVKAKIERTNNSISEAVRRIGGNENLGRQLRNLEGRRKNALLAGKDLSKLDAEILAMRDAIEREKMAVGMAEQDAATLRAYSETLYATRKDVEEVLVQITAKASALFCYAKVAELNRKTEELAALVREVAAAKARTRRRHPASWGVEVMEGTPRCNADPYILPLWEELGAKPNGKGGVVYQRSRANIVISLNS